MDIHGKKALVVGMARSGIASARLLRQKGADVWLYDAKELEAFDPDTKRKIGALHGTPLLGAGGAEMEKLADEFDLVVLSPGVPPSLPFIRKAAAQGAKVIAEIELGYLFSRAEFIAVTGTNGKTTTTALTGEIFKNAGRRTFILGNIGVPVTQEALNTRPGDIVVAEAAALQLETIDAFRPKACAVLNITEDHLDRFGDIQRYTDAKARVFENQEKGDYCVLNRDNDIARSLAAKAPSRVVWFSRREAVEGAFVHGEDLVFRLDGREKYICNVRQIRMPGSHNLENALAAAALSSVMGVSAQVIRFTLMTFEGVEHRIEFVRESEGIRYVNDSKGTNPDATIRAVEAMNRPTVLILGGYDKHSDFTPLFAAMDARVKAVVALGDTADNIAQAARQCGFSPVVMAAGFEDAVMKARALAKPGYTVLLSPACASYDMFRDFEERGRVFKEIVHAL